VTGRPNRRTSHGQHAHAHVWPGLAARPASSGTLCSQRSDSSRRGRCATSMRTDIAPPRTCYSRTVNSGQVPRDWPAGAQPGSFNAASRACRRCQPRTSENTAPVRMAAPKLRVGRRRPVDCDPRNPCVHPRGLQAGVPFARLLRGHAAARTPMSPTDGVGHEVRPQTASTPRRGCRLPSAATVEHRPKATRSSPLPDSGPPPLLRDRSPITRAEPRTQEEHSG